MPDREAYYDETPAAAARYDALHADRTADVAFYVAEARRSGGPVLEVGCGTGRVTLPIAGAGVDIVGLERSPWMLAEAARKARAAAPDVRRRLRLVRADMRAYAFRRPFARVFLPFRVLQAMLEVPDQLAALRRARASLAPAGRLVLDVFDPRYDLLAGAIEAPSPLAETGRSYREPDGTTVVEKFVRRYEPVRQVLDQTFVYERTDETGRVLDRAFEPLRLRYFFRWEMEHLLARAGFAVEALHGGWDREPFDEHGVDQIWIARPTGGDK